MAIIIFFVPEKIHQIYYFQRDYETEASATESQNPRSLQLIFISLKLQRGITMERLIADEI